MNTGWSRTIPGGALSGSVGNVGKTLSGRPTSATDTDSRNYTRLSKVRRDTNEEL